MVRILLMLCVVICHASYAQTQNSLVELLKMSEQLDHADKQDLRELLRRADDCTVNRNFICSESNIERASKLARDSTDKKFIESSRQKVITEKQIVAKENREAEERLRIAEEKRLRREEEEARQFSQSSNSYSSGNAGNLNNYFQQQMRNNQNVISQLNNQQRQVEDLRRQEYQRQQAQEQSRRERAQQEERERQRQQQAQGEARNRAAQEQSRRERAQQEEQERQRQQQAQKDAKDRADQIEREQQLRLSAQRDAQDKLRQIGATQVAGLDLQKQVTQNNPVTTTGDTPAGKIVDQVRSNSGFGELAKACPNMEARLRKGFEGTCKDQKLISVGECKCRGTNSSWSCDLHYREWRARDIVCSER